MAEKKYKFPMILMLLTLVLIFYLESWQESKKFITPAPITFRVANSSNSPMQKMDMTISKDFRHIDVTNIPTDRITLSEPNFSNENGNIETSLDVTYRLRSSKESQKLVTHVPMPDRASHLTNSTEKNKNVIGVRNIPTSRTTVDESKFNESGNSKVSFNDTCKIHECPSKKPCIKQIQLWASFHFKQFSEKEYNCPEENCKARFVHSNSYDKLKTSHAVILHHKGSWKWKDLVRSRPDGQLWIYMTKESPIHSRKMMSPDHHPLAYNWSMTYHTESDFVIPYGRYIEGIPEIHSNDTRNWAAGKTRLIAWMASNCAISSWARMQFVKNLERLIQVDTFGDCGKLKCPRNTKCDEILSSHKFYLSLENSQCQDYITEKFWKNAFTHHLVPIVYGTTRKDYEKVAPPNSFIHLSDFKNMTSLVDYVKYLDTNDTAYNEYFEWRKRGSTTWYNEAQFASPESLLCPIVHKLRDIDDKDTKRTKMEPEVVDIKNWWKPSCVRRKSVWAT